MWQQLLLPNIIIMHYLLNINFSSDFVCVTLSTVHSTFGQRLSSRPRPPDFFLSISSSSSTMGVVIISTQKLDKNNNKFSKEIGTRVTTPRRHSVVDWSFVRFGCWSSSSSSSSAAFVCTFCGVIWHNCTKTHLDLFSHTESLAAAPPEQQQKKRRLYLIISIV